MPRKPSPIGSATVRTSRRWAPASLQVSWRLSSGAPDSSSWPAGSSVTDAPSRRQRDDAAVLLHRCPAEAGQPVEQRLDAAIAIERRRAQVVEAEAELLVLGADPPVLARTHARGEVLDQLVRPAAPDSIGTSLTWLGPDTRTSLSTGAGDMRVGPAFARAGECSGGGCGGNVAAATVQCAGAVPAAPLQERLQPRTKPEAPGVLRNDAGRDHTIRRRCGCDSRRSCSAPGWDSDLG